MRTLAVVLLITLPAACLAGDQTWRALFAEEQRLRELGDYSAARDAAQKTLEEAERLQPIDARLGMTLSELAWLEHALGRPWVAEKLYLRSIRLLEQQSQEPLALGKAMSDLASLYTDYGPRYAVAEQLRRRALAIAIAEYGPRHPEVAPALSNLSSLRAMRGDLVEARALLENAREVLANVESKYQPLQASVLANLAVLCTRTGRFEEAIAYLLQAVPIVEKSSGFDHPDLLVQLHNLGQVYLKLDRPALAAPPLRRAVAIAEAKLGPEHHHLARLYSLLAVAERKSGAKKEAARLESRSRSIAATLSSERAFANSRVDVADLVEQSPAKKDKQAPGTK